MKMEQSYHREKNLFLNALILIAIVVVYILSLWIYVLIGISVIIIFSFFRFLFKNRQNIEYYFISTILGKKGFIRLQRRIIDRKYHIHQEIGNSRILAEIIISQQFFLKPLLRYFNQNNQFLIHLPLYTQKLIKEAHENNYSVRKLDSIYQYYSLNTLNLIETFINNGNIDKNFQERIIYEINYEEISLLEKNLPRNHPILEKIYKLHKIKLNNGFEILP